MPEPQTAGDHEPTCDLSVVVPVYKEEANIAPFLERMESVLKNLGGSYEIIFCLDPSPDRTEEVILEEINRDPRIKLVVFSRRFGQPSATMAGLLLCKGAACVVIDVDLQDPPELIPELYTRLRQGYEVVYAKRHSRKGETVVKRIVSKFGYWVIARLSDVQIPRDTGDFRIMTRRVIEELRALNESHGFLRGLVAYVGFKQTFVEYERDERAHGHGNYNRFVGSLAGALVAGFSFLLGAWYVFQKLVGFELSPGLPTTVLVVTFFAGVQLLSLGLIGEYVGRIYDEVKRRPMFIIDRKVNF